MDPRLPWAAVALTIAAIGLYRRYCDRAVAEFLGLLDGWDAEIADAKAYAAAAVRRARSAPRKNWGICAFPRNFRPVGANARNLAARANPVNLGAVSPPYYPPRETIAVKCERAYSLFVVVVVVVVANGVVKIRWFLVPCSEPAHGFSRSTPPIVFGVQCRADRRRVFDVFTHSACVRASSVTHDGVRQAATALCESVCRQCEEV